MFILLEILLYSLLVLISILLLMILIPMQLRFRTKIRKGIEFLTARLYWIPYLLEVGVIKKGEEFRAFVTILGMRFFLSAPKKSKAENKEKEPADGRGEKNENRGIRHTVRTVGAAVREHREFYRQREERIKHLGRYFYRLVRRIITRDMVLKITDLHIIAATDDPFETHMLQQRFFLLKSMFPLPQDDRFSCRFDYFPGPFSASINVFFYIKLYSILIRLAGMLGEYRNIKNMIQDYADFRNTGQSAFKG